MRVLVAPDKFAGTLTAVQAAEAMAAGWLRVRPDDTVDQVPLSDGGPGFVDVLHAALGGRLVAVDVTGPLGGRVAAQVLVVDDPAGVRRAYVESAEACGLALVGEPSSRSALEAGTAGVADLLRAALDEQADEVVVGVGGTASTDGGRRMVARLGGVGSWPEGVRLVVATDVTAPLLGPQGAATAFGPQKGAGPDTVRALEEQLEDWVEATGGPADLPGAGAGGGLAYGLVLLGGSIASGVRTVTDAVGLQHRIRGAVWVLTGEGRFDASSLTGKVPAGVAAAAQEAGVPCIVLAGDLGPDLPAHEDLVARGVAGLLSLTEVFGRRAALADPAERLGDLTAGLLTHQLRAALEEG